MKLMGHRGVASLAPENTLASMMKVAELGLEWVEIDTHLTSDNIPVVIHDETVNRCTNGSGHVRHMLWEELKHLDAGSWFDSQFSEQRIPSLEQALDVCYRFDLQLNLEVKCFQAEEVALLCNEVAKVINAHHFPQERLVISSFSTAALMAMQQLLPNVRRGQLWQKIPLDWKAKLQGVDAYSVHCDYRYLTEAQALEVKKAGFLLYCYTPNVPEEVAEHWQWGVDMMITDAPQHYLEAPESGAEVKNITQAKLCV